LKKMFGITLILFLLGSNLWAAKLTQQWQRLVDLRGQWKFSIGDNFDWASPEFDDVDWSIIFAPSHWEEEGYPGYDGYAWYRKTFYLKKIDDGLYLELGQIDDVDEVYLNGKLIGASGRFPPDYATAYNQQRRYHIPASYLRKGQDNTIAIRVFDAELGGGIINGKLAIMRDNYAVPFVASFEGEWKFRVGDSKKWKNIHIDDTSWDTVFVPMRWEIQGYADYDGYAWYRLHFTVDSKFKNERLVLSLGKIDDLDEVYLNGNFVGATSYMGAEDEYAEFSDEWLEYRDYRIDGSELNFYGENILAVRVFDGMLDGGIYEGPVGLILVGDYWDWRRKKKEETGVSDFFNLFDFWAPTPGRDK
jgi:Glycosyl hydrolases family 2, sugar binding domain/Beta-galactosidase second all-beta domain